MIRIIEMEAVTAKRQKKMLLRYTACFGAGIVMAIPGQNIWMTIGPCHSTYDLISPDVRCKTTKEIVQKQRDMLLDARRIEHQKKPDTTSVEHKVFHV